MTNAIQESNLSDHHKQLLEKIIQGMLNEVNTTITHLGINNYVRLHDEVAKILVATLEDRI